MALSLVSVLAILSIVPQILEHNDVPGSITMGNLVIVLTMVAFLLVRYALLKTDGSVRTGSLAGLVAGLTQRDHSCGGYTIARSKTRFECAFCVYVRHWCRDGHVGWSDR